MVTEFVLPHIGSRPIHKIAPADVLAALRPIEARGKHETAHRTKQYVGQIFRYAVATSRAERDITDDLRGALTPATTTNHAAVTDPAAIGAPLRAIDGYCGQPVTHAALKLAPLVFVRPGELRKAEWSEINLNAAEWRIPAQKMKMRELHIAPLSQQAPEILRNLQPLTGEGQYVLPSIRSGSRPMSENTINGALRRLGYANEEMTGHGFRAMASTCLNEQGWHPDVIELQLAHAKRNKVRAAYNRSTRLADRKVSVFRRPSCQLSFLASVRASEAELATVDFVGDDALAERGADRLIQALQELMDAFAVTTHERGEHGALIRGDGRSLDRSDPPERDLTTRPGE